MTLTKQSPKSQVAVRHNNSNCNNSDHKTTANFNSHSQTNQEEPDKRLASNNNINNKLIRLQPVDGDQQESRKLESVPEQPVANGKEAAINDEKSEDAGPDRSNKSPPEKPPPAP